MTLTTPAPSRRITVSASRLEGWVERFSAAHGGVQVLEAQGQLTLTAEDGGRAELSAYWPVSGRPGRGQSPIQRLVQLCSQPRTVALVLIRRGGYGVGIARQGKLLHSKVGTRYVQSRTAAGGWSQQRFARRRANQADAMVEAVAKYAAALPLEDAEYCLPGGDRAMAHAVLSEPVARRLHALEKLEFEATNDPNRKVLQEVAAQITGVRVSIWDPQES